MIQNQEYFKTANF